MAASAGPEIVEDGLVLYLDAANERSYPGTGTTWYDLSKNGNELNGVTLFNSNTKTFDFDFNQPDMVLKNEIFYSINSAWTIQVILNPPTGVSGSWNYLFGGDWGSGGYWFFHASGRWGTYSDFFESSSYLAYSSQQFGSAIPYDTFSVICMTARLNDLSINQMAFDIYVNGVFKQTMLHTMSSRTTNSLHLKYIGAGGRKGNYNLSQIINWDRLLSDIEIQQNFNATRSRFGI